MVVTVLPGLEVTLVVVVVIGLGVTVVVRPAWIHEQIEEVKDERLAWSVL